MCMCTTHMLYIVYICSINHVLSAKLILFGKKCTQEILFGKTSGYRKIRSVEAIYFECLSIRFTLFTLAHDLIIVDLGAYVPI